MAMAIGAFVNTAIQTFSGNINSTGDFFKSVAIGAASSAAGAGVTSAVSATVGAGFFGGAISGSAGGATAGFIGGGLGTSMNGGDFWRGAGQGALYGAIGGGLIGGITGGIQATKSGADFWNGTFDENSINHDQFIVSSEKNVLSGSLEKDKMYYALELNEKGKGVHALGYDANENVFYEVQHPEGGEVHGLINSLKGGDKSFGYKWNMSNDIEYRAFWDFLGGRSRVLLSPVDLPFKQNAIWFYNEHVGKAWNYNFFTNNCKHFVLQGFNKGGAYFMGKLSMAHPSWWGWGSFVRELKR
jgi:hypothetical protein